MTTVNNPDEERDGHEDPLFEHQHGADLNPDCILDVTVDGQPVRFAGKRIRVALAARSRRFVLELDASAAGSVTGWNLSDSRTAYVPSDDIWPVVPVPDVIVKIDEQVEPLHVVWDSLD